MDLGLAGRVFVVGGSSAGLGLAAAGVLVAEGARVVIVGRHEQGVDAAVTKLGVGSAVGCVGDLAHPAVTAGAIETAVSRFGRLDGALANTGGPPRSTLLTTTDEQWRQAFDSAFLAPVRLAREVGLHAQQNGVEGAAICFVLSISVRSPLPQLAMSNGLRPGLAMLVKELADELGPPPNSMRVTGVLPGSFATARSGGTSSTEQQRDRFAGVPLRRIGDPLELGRVAAFLLSPAASYVTGAVLAVDGGACRAL